MRALPFKAHRLALALAAVLPAAALAAPGANSPYRTDRQHSHVEDATSRGISQVNMITCFMSSMRPDALVNQGDYVALVDDNKCDPESRSSTSNSGSTNAGASAASYMKAVVNSSRTSNTEPMRVKTWVEMEEEGFAATIFVNTSATQAPSDSNPFGVFRLDYCGKGEQGPCMMNGFLEGTADGINYFETESNEHHSHTRALRLSSAGADSGAGRLSFQDEGQQVTYSFAYNADYFRRSDGQADQCFSRDANDPDARMSVWRYGLYDAENGNAVTRNSGFPIEFTGSDGKTFHGHMGYWGLWLPHEAPALQSGATVQRVEYRPDQPPLKTDYTVARADGRLMKYTKKTKTLADIDKIKFNTWIWQTEGFYQGAEADRQYEMYWDDAANAFRVSGVVECGGEGGCETRSFDTEPTVQPSYFGGLGGMRGWSQALGGELFISLAGVSGSVQSATTQVVYRQENLVYPADMPATLHCLRDCPTAQSIADYFSPNSQASSPFVASTYHQHAPATSAVSYSTTPSDALLRDAAGAALTFTNRDAMRNRPHYEHGIRTGRLFANLNDARCDEDQSRYCDHKVETLDTYYQWETGPNQWNQFAAVKDANGYVTFDAPLQVSYNVPQGAAYGQYAGKSIVLQYGGFGELWGIPGHCVSPLTNDRVSCDTPRSRYVPAFVIPFSEEVGRVSDGTNTYLVKWLDREIRFARKNPSVCAAAGLDLPAELTLPTADGLRDPSDASSSIYIGAKPVVTGAPRVIHGEVKY